MKANYINKKQRRNGKFVIAAAMAEAEQEQLENEQEDVANFVNMLAGEAECDKNYRDWLQDEEDNYDYEDWYYEEEIYEEDDFYEIDY